MHPDMRYTQFRTLPDDLFGDLGAGEDKDGVDLFGDGLQVGITGVVLVGSDARINRIDLISIFLEVLVGRIAARLALV
jgi:hypothetical protein